MSDDIDLPDLPKDWTARLDLALALLARTNRWRDGLAAMRATYPKAPEASIESATHHLFGDLPGAFVDMLAISELALREPGRELGYGASYHALYHLYNWLQFRALLPEGMQGFHELVKQLEELADDGDLTAIRSTVAELRDRVDATLSPPQL